MNIIMVVILQIREAMLTEDQWIAQISELEPERVIVNAYQFPYHVAFVCAQSCLTLCSPMDWSLLGSSVLAIFHMQAL